MRKAFIYKDEKSDKFWTINCSGTNLAINYGTFGSVGKFEIQEFPSELACERGANNLIKSKLKKGYQEYDGFDFKACIYIDDAHIGLHRKTSHPNFSKHFTHRIYYDNFGDETPFGNHTGYDTLRQIESHIKKDRNLNFDAFPKYMVEKIWEMRFIEAETITDIEYFKQLCKQKMGKLTLDSIMYQSDQVIVATAFAQIKITGKISKALKYRAILSMKRLNALSSIYNRKKQSVIQICIEDLTDFKA